MKKFTGIEKAALAFAVVLLLGGASLVVWPEQSGVVIHPGGRYTGSVGAIEEMSAPKSRLWGGVAMAFGIGLAAIVVNGRNK